MHEKLAFLFNIEPTPSWNLQRNLSRSAQPFRTVILNGVKLKMSSFLRTSPSRFPFPEKNRPRPTTATTYLFSTDVPDRFPKTKRHPPLSRRRGLREFPAIFPRTARPSLIGPVHIQTTTNYRPVAFCELRPALHLCHLSGTRANGEEARAVYAAGAGALNVTNGAMLVLRGTLADT